MLSNQETEELIGLVEEGHFLKVFERLGRLSSHNVNETVSVLKSRYLRLERQKHDGTITDNQYDADLNKITVSSIELINGLKEADQNPEKKEITSKKDKEMFHTIGRRDDLKGLEKTELGLVANFLEKVQRSRRKINELPTNSHYLPDLIKILVDLEKELKQKESRWGETNPDAAIVSGIRSFKTRTNGLLMEISRIQREKNATQAADFIRSMETPYYEESLRAFEQEISKWIKKLSIQ